MGLNDLRRGCYSAVLVDLDGEDFIGRRPARRLRPADTFDGRLVRVRATAPGRLPAGLVAVHAVPDPGPRYPAGCHPRPREVQARDSLERESLFSVDGRPEGIVKDAADLPVEHALVSAARHDVTCGCVAPSAWTDATGHFALHALAFGHYVVVANRQTEWDLPNRQPFQEVTLGPADRVKTIEIRLQE